MYDKCEIPFRDDYVLLSFAWVTTDPLLPSTYTHLYTHPFLPLALFLPGYTALSEGKKGGSGIVGLRHCTIHYDTAAILANTAGSIRSIFPPSLDRRNFSLTDRAIGFLSAVINIEYVSDRYRNRVDESRILNKETFDSINRPPIPSPFLARLF